MNSDEDAFSQAAKHRILATFYKWDTDKSGGISEVELANVLSDLGMDASQIKDIFREADCNNDGEIKYEEFSAWLFKSAPSKLPVGAEKTLWQEETLKQVLTAATKGEAEKAVRLIERDSIITADCSDAAGTTLLMAAAKGGQVDMVKSLLEMGCEGLNAVDEGGLTALDWAHANSKHSVISYMTKGRVASDNSVVPFLRALLPSIQRGDADAVRYSVLPRVRYQIDIDRHSDDVHGLKLVPCGRKHLEVKKIEAGLVENWNLRNPSMCVKPGDHIIQVNGAVGDYRDIQLELTHFKEQTIVLERYWPEQGFSANALDARGTPIFHHAVRPGADKKNVMLALVECPNLLINAKDRHGQTALDSAEEQGLDDIAEILKQNGGRQSKHLRSKSNVFEKTSSRNE